METWRKADFDKAIGYEVNFIRIINQNHLLVYLEDYITKKEIHHKQNWCVYFKGVL